MGTGIGISLAAVLVSYGYRGGSLNKFRLALRAIVLALVYHGLPHRFLIGIGTGISWVPVSAPHGHRYEYLIGIGIGVALVSMLVYYVYSAIWDIVSLCLRYRSYSTKVQQSSLGVYYVIGDKLILCLRCRSYSTKVQQSSLGVYFAIHLIDALRIY